MHKGAAVCKFPGCGKAATRTQRLYKEGGEPVPYDAPLVVIEGEAFYEPRCIKHHCVPGKPKLDKILKKYPVELVEIELPIIGRPAFVKYENEDLNPSIEKARRIIPWENNSEGFFVSKLKKIDTVGSLEKFPAKERKFELLDSSGGKIKNIISETSENFGIDKSRFDEFKYMFKKEDIYFVDKNWDCENLEMFMRIGSKFGSIDKRNSTQLHTLAAQTLGKHATQNVVELENKSELETYFGGRIIKRNFVDPGQKIVRFGDYILGTGVASKDGLKSQFPRAFRTQEIIIHE